MKKSSRFPFLFLQKNKNKKNILVPASPPLPKGVWNKLLNLNDLRKVALLMKAKAHTTGLEQIRQIKSEMNRGRAL